MYIYIYIYIHTYNTHNTYTHVIIPAPIHPSVQQSICPWAVAMDAYKTVTSTYPMAYSFACPRLLHPGTVGCYTVSHQGLCERGSSKAGRDPTVRHGVTRALNRSGLNKSNAVFRSRLLNFIQDRYRPRGLCAHSIAVPPRPAASLGAPDARSAVAAAARRQLHLGTCLVELHLRTDPNQTFSINRCF